MDKYYFFNKLYFIMIVKYYSLLFVRIKLLCDKILFIVIIGIKLIYDRILFYNQINNNIMASKLIITK